MHNCSIAVCSALIGLPAAALANDIPMVLVGVGLHFSPETPTPLDPTHPLYRGIDVAEIENLPATVKSSSVNFIAAAKRSSINTALRQSFERMNLLAPDPAVARKRLIVSWSDSHAPFHIGISNTASVTLHYRLVRTDNGQILFDRDITTSAGGRGGFASTRDNGIVRAAIGANFASAANCLDHAAYGAAPVNCALTPEFSVVGTIKPR